MYKLLLSIVLCSWLVSCGGGSSSSDDSENNTLSGDNIINGDNGGETGENVSEEAGNSSESSGEVSVLEGNWLKSCGPVDDTHYDIVSIHFQNNQFMSNIENYEDATCTVPLSFSPNPTADGTFTLGNMFVTSGGLEATEIESNITQFNGAPFIIDEYDIFYIDGDNLYFGDVSGVNDASTPELRPNTLDFFGVFVRQE